MLNGNNSKVVKTLLIITVIVCSSTFIAAHFVSLNELFNEDGSVNSDDKNKKRSESDGINQDDFGVEVELPDTLNGYDEYNPISPIGINVLVYANESSIQLIEDLFSNSLISPVIVDEKEELFTRIGGGHIDIIILCSGDENFTSAEIDILESYISEGKIIMATGDVFDLNPELENLFGIDQYLQTPAFLTDSSIISEYYWVKDYLDQYISSIGGGTLFTAKSDVLTLAQFDKLQTPVLTFNKTSDKNELYSGESITLELKLKNEGWAVAYDIEIVESIGNFIISSSNYPFIVQDNQAIWTIDSLEPGEYININFAAVAPNVLESYNHTFETSIKYHDVNNHEFQYPDVILLNLLNLEIGSPSLTVEVKGISILAWYDDESDLYFINEVLGQSDAIVKVNNIGALISNLTQNHFEILWLMNFGWIDLPVDLSWSSLCNWLIEMKTFHTEFSENEAKIIKDWVKHGGKLISSDWALKASKKSLQDLYGISHVGGIPLPFIDITFDPNFEWDWYHKIDLTENHSINGNFTGESLISHAWAFKVYYYNDIKCISPPDIGQPTTIASFSKPLGIIGKCLFPDYPAITISEYGNGSGVYFAADIGRSAYKGYNSSAWVEIAKNAMRWLAFNDSNSNVNSQTEEILENGDSNIIIDYTIPDEWLDLYFTTNLPSITVNSFGKGKSLFFAYRTNMLENEIIREIVLNACFRMIVLEDEDGFILDINGLTSKSFHFLGEGKYILYVETNNYERYSMITTLDGIVIDPFEFPLNWSYIPIELIGNEIHEIEFQLNLSASENPNVAIEKLSIQSPVLLYDDIFWEEITTKEFFFKGGGYLAFMTNTSGEDVNIIIDGEYLRAVNNTDYTVLRNYKYLEYGLHSIKINGTEEINCSSLAVFNDIDLDGDGIEMFREILYQTDPDVPDPWIIWNSLIGDFSLNNSERDYNFKFTGNAFIYIPSDYSGEDLYLNLSSVEGAILNFKIDDTLVFTSRSSPANLLIETNIDEGFHYVIFDYIETELGCHFSMDFIIKDISLFTIYDSDIYDLDGDGITDSDEVVSMYHPLNPDMDGDLAFDGIDNSPTVYDVIPSNSIKSYEYAIYNRSYTVRMTVQIQRPDPCYLQENLPWNEGHIDIVPMLRIFGPEEYSAYGNVYSGDYLPDQAMGNGYVSVTPLIQLTDEIWMSTVFYDPYNPAFNDNQLKFTFDMVWMALQVLDNGSMIPLHLWKHPNDIIIQGLLKAEISPVDLSFVLIKDRDIALNYYDFIRIQMAPYTDYNLQIPASFNDNIEVNIIRNIDYLDSSEELDFTINTYKSFLNDAIEQGQYSEFYLLTSIIQETIISPLTEFVSSESDSTAYKSHQAKSDNLLRLFKNSEGHIDVELTPKAGFNNYYSDVESIKFLCITDNSYYLESVKAIELIGTLNQQDLRYDIVYNQHFISTEGTDEEIINKIGVQIKNLDYKMVYTYRMTILEGHQEKITLEVIEAIAILNNFEIGSEINKLIELKLSKRPNMLTKVFSKFSSGVSNFFKIEYIKTKINVKDVGIKILKTVAKPFQWLYTTLRLNKLVDAVKNYGTKLGKWLYSILPKFLKKNPGSSVGMVAKTSGQSIKKIIGNFIKFGLDAYTFVMGIVDLLVYIEFAITAWDGSPVYVKALLIGLIVAQIASVIVSGIALSASLTALFAGGTAAAGGSTAIPVIGVLIAIAIIFILLLLWWLLPEPEEVDFDIITDESEGAEFAPHITFNAETNQTVRFAFSPEEGALLNVSLYVKNKGDAIMDKFNGIVSFGDYSWGPPSIIPGIPYFQPVEGLPLGKNEIGKLSIWDTCNLWGPRRDAIIMIVYEFRNDGIDSDLELYIPLDLDINVFPTTVEEFIIGLENDPFKSMESEAVVVHIVTDGGLKPQDDGIIIDCMNVYQDFWRLVPSFISDESEINDIWAVSFVPRYFLPLIRVSYIDEENDGIEETFRISKLYVIFNGTDYTYFDAKEIDENYDGLLIGKSKPIVIGIIETGWIIATFSPTGPVYYYIGWFYDAFNFGWVWLFETYSYSYEYFYS